MDTKSEDRLLRLAVLALLTTIGGELIGSDLLMTVSLAVFALALVSLFAVMSVVFAVGLAHDSKLPALDSEIADSPR